MLCCLSFFLNVMIKLLKLKIWCFDDLDIVLYIGDYIYRYLKKYMKYYEEYLLVNDLLNYVIIEIDVFFWIKCKIYFGNILFSFVVEYFLLCLEFVFLMCLLIDIFVIFVCKGNVLGIFYFED